MKATAQNLDQGNVEDIVSQVERVLDDQDCMVVREAALVAHAGETIRRFPPAL